MKKTIKQDKKPHFFWWLLLFFSLFFLINNLNQFKVWFQINRLLDQEEERLGDLKEEKKKLEEEKEHVQSEDFFLKEAREKLGLVKPNQVKVVIPNKEIIPTPAPVKILPNWQRWWQLFSASGRI